MRLHNRLPELIGLVYEAALDAGQWGRVMLRLTDALGGPAALTSEDRASGSAHIHTGTFDPHYVELYAAQYVSTNVWKEHSSQLPLNSVVTDRVAPREAFERSEWLHDWLRPQGLYHGLGMHLQQSGTRRTSVSVMRSARRGDWTAEEITFWRALMRHVGRTIEVHQRLAAATFRRDAGLSGLAAVGVAVVVVDGEGRLLWANGTAEAALRSGDGVAVRGGCVAATNPRTAPRLTRLIVDASARRAPSGGALKAPRLGGPPLDLLVCPVAPSAAAFGLSAPAALIFIHDPACAPTTSEAALRQLWGLSPAEARLLLGLLRGLDLDAYAEEAGVAGSTVRTLLKRLMRKMGENRQAGVVRAALANPIARLAARLESD